jgi:hypothetical protein
MAQKEKVEKPARRYVSQANVPSMSLADALRVPRALADHYAKQPTRPIDVALALEMTPSSGTFRTLCGAAVGYGLTEGGPKADTIGLSALGMRAVAPLTEGDDRNALREAVLTPTVEGEFLRKYDSSPLPASKIAQNVLEALGVPADALERVFSTIMENARSVGYIKDFKGKEYVDLGGVEGASSLSPDGDLDPDVDTPADDQDYVSALTTEVRTDRSHTAATNRKVFVSHGKSRRVVEQLKELLMT